VFKRELVGYFSTPLAYVLLVIFLFFSSFLTFQQGFFEAGQASMRIFFSNLPLLFIFLGPAIAMRLWAAERRTNSIELLLTLPITPAGAVLGKFFAAWAFMGLALVLTFPMLLTVIYLGDPDPGPIITGYFGAFLLAGAYLAIGGFCSSLTRNQVIAFVLAVVVCSAFLFAGSPIVLDYLNSFLPMGIVEAVEGLSFRSRFESMQRGVIELRDVIFFLALAGGWLWATSVAIEERRTAG
jgi:ABC-2 type transport system permease protein